MSFPRYPKYKDSGVEWLGAVPEAWSIMRSRRLFRQRNERARADDEQLTASQRHGIVSQQEFMLSEGRAVVRVIHGADILKHVEPNDFVISMRSFQGGLEWSDRRGSISSAYVMLIPDKVVKPEYFRYVFKCGPYIQALQSTSNLVRDGQAMRYENFTQVDLPLPSETEQLRIATFLDKDMSRVDALIEEQRRLIELLKEKRQAVISHAVIKGIDANVELKDSDVDWIALIPSHWSLIRFGIEVIIGEGQVDPLQEPYSTMVLIGPEHIEAKTGHLFAVETAAEQGAISGKYLCRKGDIVYSKIRPALAKAVIAPEEALCSADCYPLRCKGDRLKNSYLHWLLLSKEFTDWATLSSDRVAMPKVNRSALNQIFLPVPPLQEQSAIVGRIRAETRKLDSLSFAAASAIKLLQERRSALISAAVTGQIDVRNDHRKKVRQSEEMYEPV